MQDDAQPTEPHWSGLFTFSVCLFFFSFGCFFFPFCFILLFFLVCLFVCLWSWQFAGKVVGDLSSRDGSCGRIIYVFWTQEIDELYANFAELR